MTEDTKSVGRFPSPPDLEGSLQEQNTLKREKKDPSKLSAVIPVQHSPE